MMSGISAGAVGAAMIAGLVSLLGLVIGKEQKVSEFRQAWIDELRQCVVNYLVYINAISDALRMHKAGSPLDEKILLDNYKNLNEANHGINLRVNEDEAPAKALLEAMATFESLANANAQLTPENIRVAEKNFVKASKDLLKFEWKRVKRGEGIYVWTKRVIAVSVVLMLALLIYMFEQSGKDADVRIGPTPNLPCQNSSGQSPSSQPLGQPPAGQIQRIGRIDTKGPR